MKTPALTLITAIIAFHASAQSCDSVRSYFGADVGITIPTTFQTTSSKENGLYIQSFGIAVKGGVRIIPVRNCNKQLKYLAEGEIRSNNWQDFMHKGTSASLIGGLEKWMGKKGYLNILMGINAPFTDSICFTKRIRPYTSLRIGYRQFYLQPIFIPRVNSKSSVASTIYLAIGFKNFSYAGVRYKKQPSQQFMH